VASGPASDRVEEFRRSTGGQKWNPTCRRFGEREDGYRVCQRERAVTAESVKDEERGAGVETRPDSRLPGGKHHRRTVIPIESAGRRNAPL
jgi:hypothetical protein